MFPLSRIFFLAIALYLAYRFVFNFLVPVFRTTKHVRQQFRNMQDAMQNGANPFQQQTQAGPQKATPSQKPDTSHAGNSIGEYIDFEEIK